MKINYYANYINAVKLYAYLLSDFCFRGKPTFFSAIHKTGQY